MDERERDVCLVAGFGGGMEGSKTGTLKHSPSITKIDYPHEWKAGQPKAEKH